MKQMSKKDLLLVSHLRRNARETMTNMSRGTGIPISTIFDKIRRFERDFISKHSALLDFSALGYHVRTNVMLKVDAHVRDDLEAYLKRDERVNSAYRVNNGFDYIFEAVFRDVKQFQKFTDEIETKFKVKDKEVFYVIDELKREAFLGSPSRLS